MTFVVLLTAAALVSLNISGLSRRLAREHVPGLHFSDVGIGWNRVQLDNFRYESQGSVLTKVEARSVEARPHFFSVLKDEIHIEKLDIEAPDFRLVRKKEASESPPTRRQPQAAMTRAVVEETRLRGGKGEIEDQTVSGPPARIQLESLDVTLGNLRYPAQAGQTFIEASSIVKGNTDGHIAVSGWLDPVNRSADLFLSISSLDLRHLHPYLRGQVTTIESARGKVDLSMKLAMEQGAYQAEGELQLSDIRPPEVRQDDAIHLPKLLLAEYLKLTGNRIVAPFKVTGSINEGGQRVDFSALLSGVLNPKVGIKAVEDQLGGPAKLKDLDEDLNRLKKRAKELKDLFRQRR